MRVVRAHLRHQRHPCRRLRGDPGPAPALPRRRIRRRLASSRRSSCSSRSRRSEYQLFIGLPVILLVWFTYVRPVMRSRLPPPRGRAAADVDAQGRGRAVRLRDRPAVPTPTRRRRVQRLAHPPGRARDAWPCRSSPTRLRVALGAALESQAPLIVVDAVELPLWPQSIATRHADTELDADRACIREIRRPGGRARASTSSTCACAARTRSTPCSRSPASARRACSCSAPTAPACGRGRSRAWCGGSAAASCLLWVAGEGRTARRRYRRRVGTSEPPGTGHVRAGPRLEAVARGRGGPAMPGSMSPVYPTRVAAGERSWRRHATPAGASCGGRGGCARPNTRRRRRALRVRRARGLGAGRPRRVRAVGRGRRGSSTASSGGWRSGATWCEGSRGWRASQAYPAELWVPEAARERPPGGRASRRWRCDLADYGVPVHICAGLTARDLVDELGAGSAPASRRAA